MTRDTNGLLPSQCACHKKFIQHTWCLIDESFGLTIRSQRHKVVFLTWQIYPKIWKPLFNSLFFKTITLFFSCISWYSQNELSQIVQDTATNNGVYDAHLLHPVVTDAEVNVEAVLVQYRYFFTDILIFKICTLMSSFICFSLLLTEVVV